MSKMKLPGFTAEAALPTAGGRYRMDGNYEGPENADRVLPQIPVRYCYKPETCICPMLHHDDRLRGSIQVTSRAHHV